MITTIHNILQVLDSWNPLQHWVLAMETRRPLGNAGFIASSSSVLVSF